MADFEIAVSKTIDNEGGDKYTETTGDKGGSTKYGISINFINSLIRRKLPISLGLRGISPSGLATKETIKELTEEQAKNIYHVFFWDANRYGEIKDQDIADKVFDMAVLIGAPEANSILQKFFNSRYNEYNQLKVDGIIGNKTLEEVNNIYCTDIFYQEDIIEFIELYCTKYFLSLCNKDKSQTKFLLGWLNRVMS